MKDDRGPPKTPTQDIKTGVKTGEAENCDRVGLRLNITSDKRPTAAFAPAITDPYGTTTNLSASS